MNYTIIDKCRFCNSSNLEKYLDLGDMPLVNNLLNSPDDKHGKAPLRLFWCNNCKMSQLDCVVDPKDLFSNYYYRSGMSKHFKNHCKNLANELEENVPFYGQFVIDIASNEGTLLKQFEFSRILGIEPATNLAKIANEAEIPTHNAFFNYETALDVSIKHGQADYITAQNVFAHVPNIYDFMHGVKRLLRENGTFIVEAPWVVDMFSNLEFDANYHEHVSYISVSGMKSFVENFGMHLDNIKYFKDIHGGTIRYYIKNNTEKPNISNFWVIENAMYRESFVEHKLSNYQSAINQLGYELISRLQKYPEGVVGLGAAAKAAIVCNYLDLKDKVKVIYDNTPEKIGKYQPGTLIPIISWEELKNETRPMLIFPWNLEKEIKENVFKIRPDATFV